MNNLLRSLGIIDLLGLVLLSISIGLGFATEILVPVLPFASPLAVVAGIAIISGALGSILLSESGKRAADEMDPEMAGEEEMIPEQWHRKMVDKAFRQGYAEGQFDGYERGVERGSRLTEQADTNQRQESPRDQDKTEASKPENLSEDQLEGSESESETEEEFQ